MNKSEKIGRLRHRIRLLQYLTGKDAYGAETRRWVVSDEIWANVEQRIVGSKEDEQAQRIVSLTNTVITLRYASTLNATMKVLLDGSVISIENVIPDIKKAYAELKAVQDEPQSIESWIDENGLDWTDEHGGGWQWSNNRDQNSEVEEGESWTDDGGITWTKQ